MFNTFQVIKICNGYLHEVTNIIKINHKYTQVPTTANDASSVIGAIKVGRFYVGRIFLTSNSGIFQQIGKIENGIFKFNIPGKIGEFNSTGDIDVLACVRCSNGGQG
jgi:hypothetical protein